MAKKYLLVITHSDDDQDRANGAIGMAVSLLSEGAELALFLFLKVQKWPTKVSRKPLQESI